MTMEVNKRLQARVGFLRWIAVGLGAIVSVYFNGMAVAEDSEPSQPSVKNNDIEKRVRALEISQSSSRGKLLNPDMSLILVGNYVHQNKEDVDNWLQGFLNPPGFEAPSRGFNLGESELVISASIDPYLRGNFVLSIPPGSDEKPGIEEGYIETTRLGNGLTLKAGRFLSGIGYLNPHHPHAWDFNDHPMIYQAMFGGSLAQDGVQLRWLAPTPIFLELGVEAGGVGKFPSDDQAKNGVGIWTSFLHAGGDLTPDWSWRSGVSWIDARPKKRAYEGSENSDDNFSGRSTTWGVDAVVKHSSGSLVQGEYFWRKENGELSTQESVMNHKVKPSGGYVQLILASTPHTRWRAGLRYESLRAGAPAESEGALANYSPKGWAVMTDYSPSEFSRFRLQYSSRALGVERRLGQFWLQYVVSLGAHGAHQY